MSGVCVCLCAGVGVGGCGCGGGVIERFPVARIHASHKRCVCVPSVE
jgi:hypothetical protein